METLLEHIYKDLAKKLLEEIGLKAYLLIEVKGEEGSCEYSLKGGYIIYSEHFKNENDISVFKITDIVPVWWDFTLLKEGVSITNDFSWEEFKKYLL